MTTGKTGADERWEQIKQHWLDEHFVFQIIGGLTLVAIGVWAGIHIFAGDSGYVVNLYTELLSIGITVFVLELLARRRDDRRAEERLKADLIVRMRSQVTDTAVSAANELKNRGWLFDGSLMNARLSGANLVGANLGGANLRRATMVGADLRNADLIGADLRNARMRRVKLQGANLQGAKLRDAELIGSTYDQRTILPVSGQDGQEVYWSPGTMMARFTDPRMSDFWEPKSVAMQESAKK